MVVAPPFARVVGALVPFKLLRRHHPLRPRLISVEAVTRTLGGPHVNIGLVAAEHRRHLLDQRGVRGRQVVTLVRVRSNCTAAVAFRRAQTFTCDAARTVEQARVLG